MAEFPLDPMLAKMICASEKYSVRGLGPHAGQDDLHLWGVKQFLLLAEPDPLSLLTGGSCCVHSRGQGIALV